MAGPEARRLGVAVIGTGFIGGVHARAALSADGVLVGVAASSPDSARLAAARLGAERAYGHDLDAVEDPAVDVIHICSPNDRHADLALAAIAAGKHVVCEKPIGLDMDQAAELRRAARERGVVAAVPYIYRYYPMVRQARAKVLAGEIGPVHVVHGSYLQDWMLSPEATSWRVDHARGGASRAFADIGSHWCDLVEFVVGDPIVRLSARLAVMHEMRPAPIGGGGTFAPSMVRAVDQAVATEDSAVVSMQFSRGALGSAVISQVAGGHKNRLTFEVLGRDGSMSFDQQSPDVLIHGTRAGRAALEREPEMLSAEAQRYCVLPAGHPQGYQDCFDAFVDEVYSAIRGKCPPDGFPGFEAGARSLELVDAVLQSANRDGAWVATTAIVGASDLL